MNKEQYEKFYNILINAPKILLKILKISMNLMRMSTWLFQRKRFLTGNFACTSVAFLRPVRFLEHPKLKKLKKMMRH